MKIKKLDRAGTRELAEVLEMKMQEIATKLGLSVKYKSGRYDGAEGKNATVSFVFSTIGEDGEVHDIDAETFKKDADLFGFKPEDLGASFSMQGDTFKITGLKPSRRKFPILAKRVSDGKVYKFPARMVLVCMGRDK